MKKITLAIIAVVALVAIFYFFPKNNDTAADKSVAIIGADTTGVVWGTYTNTKYGFAMEYPYASTLSPYLIGEGRSARFGTTTENSVMIGFGAPYDTKTIGLENYPAPIDPSMTGPVWRTAIAIEETPFFSSVEQWVPYRTSTEPSQRAIVEKQTTVAGENALITYTLRGESAETNPTVPENAVGDRTIAFLHSGKLYTIDTLNMKMEDVERIAKSFRFVQ